MGQIVWRLKFDSAYNELEGGGNLGSLFLKTEHNEFLKLL